MLSFTKALLQHLNSKNQTKRQKFSDSSEPLPFERSRLIVLDDEVDVHLTKPNAIKTTFRINVSSAAALLIILGAKKI